MRRRGRAAGRDWVIPTPIEAGGDTRSRGGWWLVPGALAIVAGAFWLRAPSIPYLVTAAAATVAAVVLARGARRWAVAFAAAMLAFLTAGALAERDVARITRHWDVERGELEFRSAAALQSELLLTAQWLRRAASRALDAPQDARQAFPFLEGQVIAPAERAIVVYRNGAPVAWSGTVRVPTDTLRASLGALVSPFYVTLYAAAEREGTRAVATALVHAEPPADRLSSPLDAQVARRMGVRGFLYRPDADAMGGYILFSAGSDTLFAARPAPITEGEVTQRLRERAQLRGVVLLAVALALLLVPAWRRPATRARRLASLAVALAVIAVVPLNALSNLTTLFDPSVYFAALGGPFTASVGALAMTSAFVLAGVLTVLRGAALTRSRLVAGAAVLLITGLGPFLLRDLARGISTPPWGISVRLWLAWEVALFLAAAALLLAGASAGRAALGARRGLPPGLAPAIAALASVLAPVLWDAPGSFPAWYPLPWIAAMAALALARRSRAFVVNAALVAATGSLVLVWGTVSRQRLALAERDVAGLTQVDAEASALLTRFGSDLASEPPPVTRAELLKAYVESDLDDAGNPVEITTWRVDSAQGPIAQSTLILSELLQPADAVTQVVDQAWFTGETVQRAVDGIAGVNLYLAVPHGDNRVTSVTVLPRTRLIPGDPFTALIGLAPRAATEPPYALTLAAGSAGPETRGGWERTGDEMHGDFTVRTARGPTRAHVEVELRSLPALVQRGLLIVLLDLVLLAALWTIVAAADGALARWTRRRVRGWAASYRTRLTLSLFAFAAVPALAFAIWSYRRLQSDDRQARELLVRETLRAVASTGRYDALVNESARLDAPLFLFADGALRATSDSLYDHLAPVGRLLPPPVHIVLDVEDEIGANFPLRVGETQTLFGYRAVGATAEGERQVIAAPARSDELALDRQRRDLGVLVLFATALGALAAFWLSGIAAQTFARPIGELREAALAIGEGEREPELEAAPPVEFRPVFAAFRRMAEDLDAGRRALEAAQRRTVAVLRNTASGVVATDREGNVTLANPRAEALLGRTLTPGMPLAVADRVGLGERVRAFLAGSLDEESFELERPGRQLRGQLTRLQAGGGGVVVTLEDVTELARAQRVLAWGEMARQVAHEIKNPLTPIRLGVQHLKRAYRDDRVDYEAALDQNVGRILAEIDRLDEIARAFSRYGTAPAERPRGEPIDVAEVVRDVVELERMGEGSVTWRVEDADAPAIALARDHELREVLLNVLENARMAGAREVCVRVVRAASQVRIEVDDDGEGVPDDVLPRVFEPHFSTRTSGSGLGLAISRTLVDGWGGEITLERRADRGTRVRVTLAAPGPERHS